MTSGEYAKLIDDFVGSQAFQFLDFVRSALSNEETSIEEKVLTIQERLLQDNEAFMAFFEPLMGKTRHFLNCWTGAWVELSGDEGFAFEDLVVSEIKGVHRGKNFHCLYSENKKQIRILFRPVGMRDERASVRNWGLSMLDVEEGALVREKEIDAGILELQRFWSR